MRVDTRLCIRSASYSSDVSSLCNRFPPHQRSSPAIPVLRTAAAIRCRELRAGARTIAADDTELPRIRSDLAVADFRVHRERLRIEAVYEDRRRWPLTASKIPRAPRSIPATASDSHGARGESPGPSGGTSLAVAGRSEARSVAHQYPGRVLRYTGAPNGMSIERAEVPMFF